MSDAAPKAAADAKGYDAVWPFFGLYAVMWAGMIGTSLNNDPIKPDYNPDVIIGLAIVLVIVVFFAAARFRRRVVFDFGHPRTSATLRGMCSSSPASSSSATCSSSPSCRWEVLPFGAAIFDASCATISQRDTAFFVWEAMAKGAFKFFPQYLPVPTEACAPATS
jgi:hypothetical protein